MTGNKAPKNRNAKIGRPIVDCSAGAYPGTGSLDAQDLQGRGLEQSEAGSIEDSRGCSDRAQFTVAPG